MLDSELNGFHDLPQFRVDEMRNGVWTALGLLSVFASNIARADTEMVGGYTWYYRITNGSAEIYNPSDVGAISPHPTGAVTIPSTLGGYTVTRIGENAFIECTGLTNVTIPDRVTSIGSAAFWRCSSLVSIDIPSRVTTIGADAFSGCSSLASVSIPASVTSIGAYAFIDCISLTSFSVSYYNDDFSSKNGLLLDKSETVLIAGVNGTVVIPNGVTRIGNYAFYGLSGLSSVTIPDGVTRIGRSAFEYCNGLTAVVIPSSVTVVEYDAFGNCDNLASVTLQNCTTQIYGISAFPDDADVVKIHQEEVGQKEPTCTENGWARQVSCNRCHVILESSTSIPALGHVEVETKAPKPPTCTEGGWTREILCSRCHVVLEASTTLPALGHEATETKAEKAATCTGTGWTRETTCTRCHAVVEASAEVPALGHIEVETKAAKAPTCTDDGWTHEVTCSRCNAVLETSTNIPNLGGHTEVETKVANAPTCTEDGWTHEVRCSRCNEVLEASTAIPNLGGHIEVETKVAKAPTCTENGWTHEVTCNRCNGILEASAVVLRLGHIEVETKAAKNPTCEENGWTHEVTCSRCNAVLESSETVPALDHARQTTIASVEPTCTANGRTAKVVCSRCGDTLETSEVIPALGHSGATTKPAVEATSGATGKTAEITCTRCGEVLEAQQTIPALGYIRNVTARQVWPYMKVEVCYDVAEDIANMVSDGGNAVATLTATYGGTTKTARNVLGDASCTPGHHTVIWDFWADGIAINQTDVTFSVTYPVGAGAAMPLADHGLSIKYYDDIDSSRYSTWMQSETAMTNDFAGWTPSLEANTLDWGDCLEVGLSSLPESSVLSEWRSAALTIPPNQCRFHGKYGNTATKDFAALISGALVVENAGTYQFASVADNLVVLYLDGLRILKNNGHWRTMATGEVFISPGFHLISIVFHEQDGGQGLSVQWKKPGDSSYSPIPQSVLVPSIAGFAYGVAVNTTSAVANGMSVSGTINLGYSPFANGEVTMEIDGETAFSSTNSGSFAWMPRTTGTHTLKHVSGSYTWTRTVNVTGIAYYVDPQPTPPTSPDSNISISSTSKSFGAGGGSGSIVTSGSGTWTATASADWITIPSAMASRNAGLPVVYQVAANSGVEPRMGYIYVSGHVFTITQAGVGASLDQSSASFETDGGSGSFTVLADAQSSWRVKSDVDWISVAVVSGTGEDDVSYTVAPFNEVSTRSGTITAAGCTFTVNQTGRRMKIAVSGAANAARPVVERDYQSHVIDVQVNALSSTTWDVEPEASWISVVDAGGGHGGDNVAIAINENPSWLARSGFGRIGTETLGIRQAGRPSAALAFSISPESTTASVKGANGVISVMATPDLPWTAQSQANWLTVMPTFQTGAGNGNVVYTASPNPTMAARTGTITVAATSSASLPQKTHVVSQPAATASVSATGYAFNPAGESFGVDVAVDDIVNWTVSENVDWISIAGDASRIGPGTVTVSAAGNPTVEPRSATVTIAGHSFSATQKGRSVQVEYESCVFGTETDYATLDVHPDGNATWTAVSSAPDWLTIWGGDGCTYDQNGNVVGTGDNTIEYIVSDYVGDGSPRSATITIGDQTVFITQRAYELSIDPSATWVSGNAGSGSVGVPATAGQVWNAIATEPWITIANGYDAGTGSGTVLFTYADNDTGEERTGRIVISGEIYTITQAARQMATVSARVEGGKGLVSGTGTYDRGTTVSLSAVANDGYEFCSWTLPNGATQTGTSLSVTADADKEIVANFRRIPYYDVNGESVREGTSVTFTAPADILDAAGTTKLVCRGTSAYPALGTSFTLVITEDISFEWDLWTTNYLVSVTQSSNGTIKRNRSTAGNFWVAVGSTVKLTATPKSGKTMFRWNVSNPENPAHPVHPVEESATTLRLRVESPLAVSAVFGVFDDTLAEALDAPALAFATGGDADWTPVVDATAQTGYTSARSGAGGANTDTWLDTTVEGSGTFSFRWRVDCEKDDGGEATWDRLAVFANGVEVARIDGKTDWETVTIPVSGPKTTIRWSFYRDDWDEPGQTHENAGWVDGVNFTAEGL